MMLPAWIGLVPGIAVILAAALLLILRARAWRAGRGADACERCPYRARCHGPRAR